MKRFTVTYEVITPESAEHGEADSYGFLDESGYAAAFRENGIECSDERRAEIIATDHTMTLRDAIGLMSSCYDSGHWFTEIDARADYASGECEIRSLHCPKNITKASYRRIGRLLGCKR